MVAAGVAVLSSLLSCSIGPIWARELRGRVVDHATKQPVSNVEVFLSWRVVGVFVNSTIGTRWATTDENGDFVMPGKFQMWFVPVALMKEGPPADGILYHPDYGISYLLYTRDQNAFPRWPEGSHKIRPQDEETAKDREKCHWMTICDDDVTIEACEHLQWVIQEREGIPAGPPRGHLQRLVDREENLCEWMTEVP